jgi:hypothetical protein
MAIDDVVAVRAVEIGSDRLIARHRVLGVSASALGLLVVPVVGPASGLLTVVILGILAACVAACLRTRSGPRYQLVAFVGGEWTTLVETRDVVAFRQLGRGLQRAFEHREDLGRMSRPKDAVHHWLEG